MAGLSPKLPLSLDADDGYALTKTMKEVAKQNFKMLLLTIPGERIMRPNFGVGVMAYLMTNYSENSMSDLRTRIFNQTKLYLPVISVEDIQFSNAPDSNFVQMRIVYNIPRLGLRDFLDITT